MTLEGIRMKSSYSGFKASFRVILLFLMYTLLIQGCATVTKSEQNIELMNIKASALTKLSNAVEATVSLDAPDESVSDEEIFKISTEDDPSLLEPFAGYLLKINRDGGHAVILMCSPDGKIGLLEDAGCTARMDEHLWQNKNSCQFTLSATALCN